MFRRYPQFGCQMRSIRSLLARVVGRRVSSDYVLLNVEDAGAEGERLRAAWQDGSLPEKQRSLVDQQLLDYRSGRGIDVFDVFVDSLRSLNDLNGMSLLEIGCSSGFYSEVLEISGLNVNYSGCDYSVDFINMARERYPALNFSVADATALSYQDNSFDIVVSGCCLLHIADYKQAIAECARVARHYVLFHRTPVVWGQPERWYLKQAYGVETIEIHFNEPEFKTLLAKFGLKLIAIKTLDGEAHNITDGRGHATRSYVCAL